MRLLNAGEWNGDAGNRDRVLARVGGAAVTWGMGIEEKRRRQPDPSCWATLCSWAGLGCGLGPVVSFDILKPELSLERNKSLNF